MNDLVLGINACIYGLNYHDPCACLVQGDKIIFAIEEERINRIKHSCGKFPIGAVEMCKQIAQQKGLEIDNVALGYEPMLWVNRKNSLNSEHCVPQDIHARYEMIIRSASGLPNAKIHFYEHHMAHAASAFYSSGFNESICVVVDGVGETATASIWLANKDGIKKYHECTMPNSLGYFYAASTAFLGFQPWSAEGKLMALAPYGKNNDEIRAKIHHLFSADYSEYDVSPLIINCLKDGYMLDIEKSNQVFNDFFHHASRHPNDCIDDWHRDFAYIVQDSVEQAVLNYIKRWMNKTRCKNVCCAGGLFMNCKMNGVLRRNLQADNFFVQPIAGDAGTALGAAFLCNAENTKTNVPYFDLEELSLGIEYNDPQVLEAILNSKVKFHSSNCIAKEVAQMLNDNKIVAWFQGRNELGARALAHRSILSAPKELKMADEINSRIKHRENWRPFACSILEDFAQDVLKDYKLSSFAGFMIEAYQVHKEWISKMGAVIHQADFSTRPQVVRADKSNALYYEMIMSYYKISGIPFVLNTSFNDKGQPIIVTPVDAIDFFITHDIDALVINNYVIIKE